MIHETLVDLLAIQQEIHPGIFAVMDGTFAGDGPGPRAMRWHVKNRILASFCSPLITPSNCHSAEDQHILATLVPGLLDCSVAIGRGDQGAAKAGI